MTHKLLIRPGLLARLRETRNIPSEDVQARMIGVDRSTLGRVERGSQPSAAFIVGVCVAFNLGPGEAFEIVDDSAALAAA
ncbi:MULTISPECIES: helix-turn-helix domain-containing protein [Mycetocola]|uniref:helix-turn-helix domain-containing protein n=1 Tax=Mycetocola TaxID=76634 RepID=UPI0004C18E2C|nr:MULTISPECIES: helix-turn-helix transcriptional regulator [Mycetocola]